MRIHHRGPNWMDALDEFASRATRIVFSFLFLKFILFTYDILPTASNKFVGKSGFTATV